MWTVMYLCNRGTNFPPFYDFGNVSTVWYFFGFSFYFDWNISRLLVTLVYQIPWKISFQFWLYMFRLFQYLYNIEYTHTKATKKKKPHTPIQVFMFLKVILFLKFQNKLFLICKSPGSIFLSYIMRKYANQRLVILENIH